MKAFTLIFVAGMIFLAQCAPKYQEVSALFPSADGIVKGASVTLNGVSIGHVSDLVPSEKGVIVQLQIDPQYSKMMVSAAAFCMIEKEGDQPALEYYVFDINSPQLKNNESLPGVMSKAGLLLLRAKYSASEGLEASRGYLKQIEKDLNALKESKEAQDIIKNLKETLN